MIFFSWKDYYQGSFKQKTDFARAWEALPRFICWKIWTTRNNEIFEGVNVSTKKVFGSEKALWADSLSTRGKKSINKEPLSAEERAWIVDLLGNTNTRFWSNTKKLNPPSWQIRMSNEEFQNWWAKIGTS